jgi:hypothetical protein
MRKYGGDRRGGSWQAGANPVRIGRRRWLGFVHTDFDRRQYSQGVRVDVGLEEGYGVREAYGARHAPGSNRRRDRTPQPAERFVVVPLVPECSGDFESRLDIVFIAGDRAGNAKHGSVHGVILSGVAREARSLRRRATSAALSQLTQKK